MPAEPTEKSPLLAFLLATQYEKASPTAPSVEVPTTYTKGLNLSSSLPAATSRRAAIMFASLLLLNLVLLFLLYVCSLSNPSLLSAGAVAFTTGLRHGLDGDHIAAIDNVSRSLLSQNPSRYPISVGVYFSLGHSSVVIVLCVLTTLLCRYVTEEGISAFDTYGGMVGPLFSATILLIVALLNVSTARDLVASYHASKAGVSSHTHTYADGTSYTHVHLASVSAKGEVSPASSGFLARILPTSCFTRITRPSQTLPLGLLFGLSFDTASSVALLVLSASKSGISFGTLVLPLLFTSAMMIVDGSDSILMCYAYVRVRAPSQLLPSSVPTLLSPSRQVRVELV